MNINRVRFLKEKKIYVFSIIAAVILIALHGRHRSLSPISYQVPERLLAQIDERMHDIDPGAIHIMQMVVGPKSPRFQVTFLKSLFITHFKVENAKPIHLHLLTDKATQFILDGIIHSWRIDKLSTTFYAAEPIQASSLKITWMLSLHSATKVATMKIYLPEILNSTVPKLLLLDTDTIFLDDVVKLWNHFDNFDKYQFLGMALEQAPMYFNLRKMRGRRVDHGYNAGIMLWDLRKLTQKKWEAIWKPTFHRAFKISPYFGSAEQTLLNAVIVDNPAIFYSIPCTWNVQMFELGTPGLCKSTWSNPPGWNIPQPQLLHADKWNKYENEFKLGDPNGENADITTRYINVRSQFHMKNGYEFRKKSLSMEAFNIQNVMAKLHPGGKVLTPNALCRTEISEFKKWCGRSDEFNFTIEHRIHPLYISGEYKKITQDEDGVTLAIGAGFAQFSKIEEIANQWIGPISLAIEATDLEAHKLLSKVDDSHILRGRKNIYYHIVFQNPDFPATISLHNTAATYSPTNQILILDSLNDNIRRLGEFVVQLVDKNPPNFSVPLIQKPKSSDNNLVSTENEFYAPSQDIILAVMFTNRDQLKGLLVPTRHALLPTEFNTENDPRTHLLALLANPSMR